MFNDILMLVFQFYVRKQNGGGFDRLCFVCIVFYLISYWKFKNKCYCVDFSMEEDFFDLIGEEFGKFVYYFSNYGFCY